MTVKLPSIIKQYIAASNAHDVAAILACFAEDAVVHDEAEELCGKQAIAGWIATTIEKYKFKFTPQRIKSADAGVVVAIEVAGTFAGSPVSLDYHFIIANDKIQSLAIQ